MFGRGFATTVSYSFIVARVGPVGMIDPVFLNSPQYVCEALSRELGCRIVLKVETMNPIRCFKGRGTETVISRLSAAANRSKIERVKALDAVEDGVVRSILGYLTNR